MADLGIIFLRRRYPIHWYQSSYIFITGSMPFRYFWATLYSVPIRYWLVYCLFIPTISLMHAGFISLDFYKRDQIILREGFLLTATTVWGEKTTKCPDTCNCISENPDFEMDASGFLPSWNGLALVLTGLLAVWLVIGRRMKKPLKYPPGPAVWPIVGSIPSLVRFV